MLEQFRPRVSLLRASSFSSTPGAGRGSTLLFLGCCAGPDEEGSARDRERERGENDFPVFALLRLYSEWFGIAAAAVCCFFLPDSLRWRRRLFLLHCESRREVIVFL